MAAYICDRCSKTLGIRQSLWNHRQRCKDTKDGFHETVGNGLIVESRSTPTHSDRFISDIINNVGKTAKEQRSALPKKRESKKNSVLSKVLSDLPLRLDFETDSNSESYSEESDTEDDEFMRDKAKELKAVFRKLYRKVVSNTENYKKLVSALDKLRQMNCLTRAECIGLKHHIQRKIDIV